MKPDDPKRSGPDREIDGGERMLLALTAIRAEASADTVTLLDEPTNNLDLRSIEQLGQALDAYRGALLVLSHDEDFLQRIGVGQRWMLHDGELRARS